ncbi:MAG: translation elongation factor Ts [Patescibacteria group bacterium]|nr:translation elongation factor Ts [Patescibacteria group bacterium]MDD5121586.1 translation elongation factor Ts [Patescibacteria group bacterium]MDD5222296.1 translation elongation factor Ts [Patescibacteria group bacterium]MDD5396250.1 translation elongation factor Ts [Patescibacteria group bacterium]
MANVELLKRLREDTGAGMSDCQKALEEAKGDFDKAVEYLRKQGQKIALNKSVRTMREGIIDAYVHANKKLAVLVEVSCETDFVARNEIFKNFVHDVAMQVAAANPRWLSPEDVPAEEVAKEKEIYIEELKRENKPAEMIDKIATGKINKFYTETCLLKQAFIKDDKKTIEDLLKEAIAKTGENLKIQRFCRFNI